MIINFRAEIWRSHVFAALNATILCQTYSLIYSLSNSTVTKSYMPHARRNSFVDYPRSF